MLKVSFAHFAMIFTEIRKRELYLLIIRLTPDITSRSVFPLCLKKTNIKEHVASTKSANRVVNSPGVYSAQLQ